MTPRADHAATGTTPGPRALDIAVDAYVRAAGIERIVLMNRAGRLVAQRGFPDAGQVMRVASLGAAIHASGQRIGELVGDTRMAQAHNTSSRGREFVLSELRTPAGPMVILTVFAAGGRTAAARAAFEAFARSVGVMTGLEDSEPLRAEEFEASLMESLEHLFADARSP